MKKYLAILMLACMGVHADTTIVPNLINYQGRMIENGQLVSRQVNMVIRLYDQPLGGNLLLEDSDLVTVIDSLYSTYIGDNITDGSFESVRAATNIYISLEADGHLFMPRERMVSVGSAIKARYAIFAGESELSSNTLQIQGFNIATQAPVAGQFLRFDGSEWAPSADGSTDWLALSNNFYSKSEADQKFATGTPVYVESDPIFVSHVSSGVTSGDISNWSLAYSWGNHATNGYLLGTSNLGDLVDPAAARSNLELGTMATQDQASVSIQGGVLQNVALAVASNAFSVGGQQLTVVSNRVGIGTAAPESALDVVGSETPGDYVFKIFSGTNVVAWGRKKP
jgi:hypothetical protein